MSTTYDTTGLPQTFAPIKPVGFFERFRVAFREWRERQRIHATLSGLSDWELLDIGTTRGEIDYVASHRDIDPRGVYPPNRSKICQRWTANLGPSTSDMVKLRSTQCEQCLLVHP
jgi:uncharacterized protein YjiS (DUF1127 family)